MLFYLVLFFMVVAAVMFIHKLVMKSRMQKALGRKVSDRELTSLTSWMEEPGDSNPKK
ncbi:MAG TPA: hypothetical protein VJU86_15485 [Pyrinomonadaceae bacterium]|nr:hypothetical protein [Pyrinomonadaceae bacterium]